MNEKTGVVIRIRNITSTTGGTDTPRVFMKRIATPGELKEWEQKLPTGGTRYQSWGVSLYEFMQRVCPYRGGTLYGAGESKAELAASPDGRLAFLYCEAVEGESIKLLKEGDFYDVSFNIGTKAQSLWVNINSQWGWELLAVSHEQPGRYNNFYFLSGIATDGELVARYKGVI